MPFAERLGPSICVRHAAGDTPCRRVLSLDHLLDRVALVRFGRHRPDRTFLEMRNVRLLPLAGALVLFAVAAAPSPAPPITTLKCARGTPTRFPNAPEPVYVLDGRAATAEELTALDRSTIESIEVVCHDEVYRRFGIEARHNGVIMFTKPGPRAVLRAALDSLAARQQAFVAEHGRLARSVIELEWRAPAEAISVDLSVSDDGTRWTAVGTHRHLPEKSATIAVSGEKPPLRDDRAGR